MSSPMQSLFRCDCLKKTYNFIYFVYIKTVINIKNTKKGSKKKHVKDNKIFLKKKKKKGEKRSEIDAKIFLKKKNYECITKYYLPN